MTETLKIHLPKTVPASYGKPSRWAVPGFDRDGDPCIVLNFDFGSCRIQQFLYFHNAPSVKHSSTSVFLESSGVKLKQDSFDAAFDTICHWLESLSAIEVEADGLLGGVRVVGYHFHDIDCMG